MPTGRVRIEGEPVTSLTKVLTVFRARSQAWLDGAAIRLPFRAGCGQGVPREERTTRRRVIEAVADPSRRLRPEQLSGGMKQRVSLAARLVLRPAILCLDEPFSALDPETRLEMHRLVLRLWQQFPCVALFVTHDVSEALRLADRIIVLSTRPATVVMDVNVVSRSRAATRGCARRSISISSSASSPASARRPRESGRRAPSRCRSRRGAWPGATRTRTGRRAAAIAGARSRTGSTWAFWPPAARRVVLGRYANPAGARGGRLGCAGRALPAPRDEQPSTRSPVERAIPAPAVGLDGAAEVAGGELAGLFERP